MIYMRNIVPLIICQKKDTSDTPSITKPFSVAEVGRRESNELKPAKELWV